MSTQQRRNNLGHCHIDHSRFNHYLLTRFAVCGPSGELPNDAWLRERFKLFEDYCLPSVLNQTCKSFSWGLLVAPNLPDWATERLLFLGFSVDNLIISHDWRSAAAAAAWVQRKAVSNMLLTTRLDNDDALAVNHVQRLHSKVCSSESQAYNFTYGLQLTQKGILLTAHNSNPFLSLSEYSDGHIQTVLAQDHDDAKHHWNLKQIRGAPAWLQVIHGGNVSNRARGLPLGSKLASRLFVLPSKSRNYQVLEFLRDLHPLRAMSRRVHRAGKTLFESRQP